MEEFDVRSLYVLTGVIVGCLYGSFAQATAFCVRRGISDLAEGKGGATLTGWFGALLVALPMTQWMIVDGHLDSSQTVYFPEALSWWTTLIGAIAFGIGMMLTRGCPARLLVLGGTGNLRAWFGLLVIGVSGYATFKGLIAEFRVELQQTATLELPLDSVLLLIPGLEWPLIALATVVFGFFALRHGLNRNLVGGLLVGFLVAGAWSMTSVLGSDDFDPMAPMSLSFVAPVGEAITYLQLASGLEPSFNVSLVLGVLLGSFVSSIVSGEFRLQSFESASDHARHFIGAIMMGIGGILALGCNTGQAITGLATGSMWSILVTSVIFASGYLMHRQISKS
ncbi:MAG: YeeE/YedE family protein [Pseudomonadota bacterium]|nr:YeeE/YedE family protein [Pseudomonadota bacterium]